MRLERLLGLVLMGAGVMSLILGISLTARLMNILAPRIETATGDQLAAFFYTATPQTLFWSIAFATFFSSGIFLAYPRSSASNAVGDVSKILRSGATTRTDAGAIERPRSNAEERIQAVTAEVLRAIKRLEKLDSTKVE